MPTPELRIQLDVLIPMRDGVRLYAALYHPATEGPFPTLLIRSPYSSQHPRYVAWAQRFAEHGYAVVMQDVRGRFESEGTWRPYLDEAADGFDTLQWLGAQPWCDGTIGTFGISYPGFTQILPAPLGSPYLKALVPIANQEDNYGHMRYNGVLQLQNAMNFIWLGNRTNQHAPRELIDWERVYRRLPLISALDDIGERPFYRDMVRHNEFDDFWSSYSMKGQYPQVEAPALFITGWYDNLMHEGFKCFAGWREQAATPAARNHSKLLVGPWTHSQIGSAAPFGDVEFGPEAAVDIPGLHLRWYDQRLRNVHTGIDQEAPLRLFVMGANVWRDEWEWPLARTRFTPFYLHSGGRANSRFGDGSLSLEEPAEEAPDTFPYDPEDPVPTLGGQSMFIATSGPRDRRAIERRDDVLVYTTDPLEHDLEVTGPVTLTLYAASSAPDTDFTATLIDVHPRGPAIHICEGIVRARFRDSFEQPSLIEPGAVQRYTISLWETSNLFRAGHRIRLEISSSNFPRFDRNLNSGATPGLDSEVLVARQTIFHDRSHPSQLTLPVIPPMTTYRIAADVGGTFTDVVISGDDGSLWRHKVLSSPPDFEQAVLAAVAELRRTHGIAGSEVTAVAHGTTVATNAVLELRGARTALVTTKGFRDVLELRRIRAPMIYDLFFDKPPTLVERRLRLELSCRVAADGEELSPLLEAELEQLAATLEREVVASVAVCFLHAYAFPEHELAVRDYLQRRLPELPLSLSSEVLPERREYERTATTVVNAYVLPVMRGYLASMRRGLEQAGIAAPLLIMQSSGGLVSDRDAATRPVFVLESGPAAGVLAAGFSAQRLGLTNAITLDMGGTTAKASMIEAGRIAYSSEYEVGATLSAGSRLLGGGGELIRAPTIDIAEVGAGGGSVAFLDQAGGLRVGPRSAGAKPGPACYRLGGSEPTVTDANVVLGYIRAGELADGQVSIDPEAARQAVFDHIAQPLGLELLRAAEGIHHIANARTMRALRQVSTERGRDPRDFALLAFGGSGPIHAAALGRELGIRRIVVPLLPGLFSALGLLFSGIEHHDVRSLMLAGEQLMGLEPVRTDMAAQMLARLAAEGYQDAAVELAFSADIRFRGQASELRVDVPAGPVTEAAAAALEEAFLDEHQRRYGHRSDPGSLIEVVALRLIGRAGRRGYQSHRLVADIPPDAGSSRPARFDGELIDTPVVARAALENPSNGPLLIDEYDSTIVVPPDMRAQLGSDGNLILELRDG